MSGIRANGGGALTAKRRERLAALVFLAPDSLGLLTFIGIPMVLSLAMGFCEIDGFGNFAFVGLDNYARAVSDPLFLRSLGTTAVYVVVMVPCVFAASLGLALLVKQKIPLVGALRAAFFLPHVVSLVVVGLVWQFILVDKIGVLNQVLQAAGLPAVSWLGDPRYALATVLAVSVWFYMGYYMVIFLAGLQDIPPEYYEAARMDGAGAMATFRHVTWPLLRPTSFFVVVVTTVAAVSGAQVFDLVYVMTQGGPANSTSLGIFYIYEQAFTFNDYGYAMALASIFVVVLVVLTGGMFAATRGGRFE